MKNAKKILSVFLAVLMCLSAVVTVSAAAQNGSYTISNPYESVDWNTVKQYKTALHSHTNASDGDPTLKESVQRHVETGFDIVATTDHGTVNYTWETVNENKLIHEVLSLIGRSEGELEYLGKDGSFENGISYSYAKAENGDDYLSLSNGKQILRLPYGIENNALSANAHVNSWFTDYHDNSLTTYEDAISSIDKAGGICVINHPGEYTKARYELRAEDAYSENSAVYRYYINKYADLLDRYDGCLGIDMNSKGDNRTRFDRILWDKLLTRFAEKGENVLAIASSDAHQLDVIDTGFTMLLMNSLTSSEARKALENGTFFAASHCIGNPEELREIASALKEFYGETDVYKKVQSTVDELDTRLADIESGKLSADSSLSVTYSVLKDGFTTVDTFPSVSSVEIDENEDTIRLNTKDALIVRWISDGKLIAVTKADDAVIDLNDYADTLGNYVRAEVFGEGGILYTQAFLLNAEENAAANGSKKQSFFDYGFIDCLFAIFKNWFDILARKFGKVC